MIIGQATKVSEDVRTLRDLVVRALDLGSFGVSPIAIDALVDEIWNAPTNANLDFPGGHMTPEDLESVLFNAAIRSGATPTEAYFYAIPSVMIATDVAPVTGATPGAPTVATAQATPDWLLPLWHFIDRLHLKSQEHAAVLQDLFDLASEGKMMAMALTTVEKFLTVIERECKAPPATSILDRIGQAYNPAGQLFDISNFHGKLAALRDAAQQNYVDHCSFPLLDQFRPACEELKKLDSDPAFRDAYDKFDKVRSRYPVTEHALQSVLAFYIMCRGFSPDRRKRRDSRGCDDRQRTRAAFDAGGVRQDSSFVAIEDAIDCGDQP